MKENRTFYISVEGINCEKMYFNHLAKLINNSNRNRYNLSVDPKKTSPLKFAKRNAYKPVDTKGNTKLPFIHIQDIEDYYDNYQKGKFYAVIKEMRDAEEFINTSYKLGYSNYTFELWMLLHVADMRYAVADRSKYLEPINRWFHRKYDKIDEFKSETEFQKILDEYITLDSIFTAIERAEKIVEENKKKAASKEITFESYKGFDFYHDNPDLTVHTVVKLILDTCEVK